MKQNFLTPSYEDFEIRLDGHFVIDETKSAVNDDSQGIELFLSNPHQSINSFSWTE